MNSSEIGIFLGFFGICGFVFCVASRHREDIQSRCITNKKDIKSEKTTVKSNEPRTAEDVDLPLGVDPVSTQMHYPQLFD